MKNIPNYSFVLFFFAILFAIPQPALTQTKGAIDSNVPETENLYENEEKIVFWFYISIRIKEDRRTRQKVYNVRRLGTRIYSGTLDEFDENVHKYYTSGH